MSKLKILPLTLKKGGCLYTQISRTDKAAIYQRMNIKYPEDISYEVFKIQIINRKKVDLPELNFKMDARIYEKFPSDSDFGKNAWASYSLEWVKEKFDLLNTVFQK